MGKSKDTFELSPSRLQKPCELIHFNPPESLGLSRRRLRVALMSHLSKYNPMQCNLTENPLVRDLDYRNRLQPFRRGVITRRLSSPLVTFSGAKLSVLSVWRSADSPIRILQRWCGAACAGTCPSAAPAMQLQACNSRTENNQQAFHWSHWWSLCALRPRAVLSQREA